ncbi:hypothetical protein [Streptomyces radiopugnans]|uniref:hypothetical protein n=1 Tax=Streptomyces radiopugnans TaxID=403935 RepID=UPI003F1DEFAB
MTRSILVCHCTSDSLRPASPTYQTAPWRSARATAAPSTERAHILHSWTARAIPYFGGLASGGPPAKRWAKCPSAHLIM